MSTVRLKSDPLHRKRDELWTRRDELFPIYIHIYIYIYMGNRLFLATEMVDLGEIGSVLRPIGVQDEINHRI